MGMTKNGLSYWRAESEGLNLLNTTIGDLLDRRADELPANEAVVYSCYPEFGNVLNIRWTYRDYRDQANQVARGLMALGLNKGDHIAIWAMNLPEWLFIEMAAAKAGLVLVTVNPVLQASEVEYILKQGDVQVLFCMAQIRNHDCLATVRTLVTPGSQLGAVSSERLPLLRHVCLLGTPPVGMLEQDGWRPSFFEEVIYIGANVSEAELSARQLSVKPRDPVQIQYTSGTTGFPKGAVLHHYGLLNNVMLFTHRWELCHSDRLCSPLPLFHTGGCVLGVLASLYVGSTLHPLLTFDPLKALQILSRERCSIFGTVPTMLLAVLQHPDFNKYDLTSLQKVGCGGSPVPVALMERVKEQIGADVTIVFGQTEASPLITQTLPDDSFERKASTVGIPLPHTEVKLIHPVTSDIVPCGEHGELCCRGYLLMHGYYHQPEKTAETIDKQGWLHTGDLATMDAQGYVNIVGRLKDMVIRGGENLFPAEIEAFLIRHPKVVDAQVVGVPDPFFGEELLAVVIPKTGEQLTEHELRDFCQGQISHQKTPRYFQFVDSYPLTASGKVRKFVLRVQAIKVLGLEAVGAMEPFHQA